MIEFETTCFNIGTLYDIKELHNIILFRGYILFILGGLTFYDTWYHFYDF